MKIGAIDLGTNSLHMVIVEVSGSGAFQVIDREKDMVRLGAAAYSRRCLSAGAVKRALEVLRSYKRLAEHHGVDTLLAVATSAVREARNGEDFLERVGREIGVWARAISGEEEARLIYLAALHSVHLDGKRAVVFDIGGGSVELALGAGERVSLLASEKLGVLRLTEAFVKSDPISAAEEKRLVDHVLGTLGRHLAAIADSGFDSLVGTSGTVLALGAMAHALEAGEPPGTLHHVTVRAETLHALRKRLVAGDLKARLKMPEMDSARADIIVAGAVVLDTVLERLGAPDLTLSEWALREGILLDYIHGHPGSVARADAYPDVRRRSVMDLAERCLYDEPHARHVAALALALFDGTRGLHELGERERGLLEYASLLHDVGHHISYPGHHKHSYYLIKNADLRGFDPLDVEIVANVARYHRRGQPRKEHESFAALPKVERRAVRVLAGILRVADALDRSHRQPLGSLSVKSRGTSLRIRCLAEGDCELELWGVGRRAELLEQVLAVRVHVDVAPRQRAAAPVPLRSARA